MAFAGTHCIDGEWRLGEGSSFQSCDPATGAVLWKGRAATREEVGQAVNAAAGAFGEWAAGTVQDRIPVLESMGDLLAARKDALALDIAQEVGKPLWESRTEVEAMIRKIAISIDAYTERCPEKSGGNAGVTSALRFHPIGVTGVFGPFNFPGHLPHGHIVPALLAGNTIVFKPSELTPAVGQTMMALWQEAGLPPGVLNLVQGKTETGRELAAHPRLDGIFFTGSSITGRAIHRACGGQPEKILALEMGGNNPLVVWDISDKQAAVYWTIQSAYVTAGQRCTCARRLIIPEGKEGTVFLELLAAAVQTIQVGPPSQQPEPFMGPVISSGAADTLLRAQQKLLDRGGVSLVRMERLPASPAMLSPGLVDVTDVADRPDAELFGPLLQVIRVRDFDAAIEEANNTRYGLSAGLFSESQHKYAQFHRMVRAGIINWNRPLTGASGSLPFGGVGASGNHRPGAWFAADYCAYPVASVESPTLVLPDTPSPGLTV